MFLEFPFEYADIEGLGRLFYPIVRAEVKTIWGFRDFEFLVDTGADLTTIPSDFLPALGLSKKQLVKRTTLGVGGISVKTWELKLPIRFMGKELTITASAVDVKHEGTPLLLGRKDMFEDKFNLLLDSKRKVTVISVNLG